MSFFIIQKDDVSLNIEKHIVTTLLKKNRYIHEYMEIGINDIESLDTSKYTSTVIPIGTIQFVSKVLNHFYAIDKENPIEIPKYLRTNDFLKRDYKIVQGKDLPRNGYYFIKNASTLKDFSYLGELSYFLYDEMFEEPKTKYDTSLRINKEDYFIVSKNFAPDSEYRVYVFNHNIEAISNYDGDPTIFPDINLLKNAIKLIKENEKFLKSYTIDVMVNKEYGTAIIEIHNFTSCGLYQTLWSDNILYAYKDGIEYLLHDNKKIQDTLD